MQWAPSDVRDFYAKIAWNVPHTACQEAQSDMLPKFLTGFQQKLLSQADA
jgi:hypothetical protein